ncbi:DNA alkylation repair protein [Paenibacillus caseinilyticus]|uniref:DNA-7-methylguanine glycosylase n=1 Tax=Paenibacillus mucilaginosus K02 TaxID=997761 RepID=I0BSZ9_9BACL|nr:DNA alkylation repair protein [Paenibacillus mucilaginosus]AFH65496.1 DNA-7-methylguanine glycosylase [Paenibacillus mucilaginosus K02]
MKSYKNAQEYTAALTDYLRAHGDEEQAVPMEAYMRHQFAFLGIRSPELKALLREWMRMHGVPRAEGLRETVRVLWNQPEREMQYAAMGLLEKRRREMGPAELPLLKELILTKPWWDTVDLLASHQVGGILANHPVEREGTVDVWIRSGQLWLQRTALLYQLGYKGKTDTGRLFGYIGHCSDSTEFFIRKAIGWALREYSKTDEAAVRAFIASVSLSPLSVREALKAAERRKGAGGAVKE